ncbi:NAD(P)H-dependent oxidoreductase [Rhizorhabdus dicambivorans]|uniref:Flavodoxin family protein n=1 Tax=Rhizorhabdus dicambivorans TaxID=1850238 RepID=A0A2A4FS59_9SPHN|nr:NAD(P)H-dependent oxidoreductase [Rhizorhabdus dicambivorans]ATE67154.1 flavodoxin family protein [Rhizorhabdus dicambivorans]PCE41575.1 flavodoxin family protein [Rhizorhabdus dicambivorans]
MRKVLVIDGHPDPTKERLIHALATAYRTAAEEAGHEVRTATLAVLDLAPLRSRAEWETGTLPEGIAAVQADLLWADHLVLLFPLWLGDMPALTKALLEQILRPGFAFGEDRGRLRPRLGGRSARLIVTMGMPAAIYRLWYAGHAIKVLRRSICGLVGIRPVRATVIGSIERTGTAERALRHMARLGRRAR